MKYKKTETGIDGLIVIEPQAFGDKRGFFMETYTKKDFVELEIPDEFVQDNHSKSKKAVLRGLHFQTRHVQGKLVRVIAGRAIDVAVDLRHGSGTFGKYHKIELTAEDGKMLYLPKGFAHGFLALEDDTEFLYKCTDYYAPEYDSGILWNDPDLAIQWEFENYGLQRADIILSEKDKTQQTLRAFIASGIRL
ncbi:MAG: dTDP-4-dehydrorhamnose 3,5-epimerase [Fusobacteriaceae bacterium]|nr:dTDP-4-dehydrorhamnose 3,5-epimerase [Fusobacteriaceae bacterium]